MSKFDGVRSKISYPIRWRGADGKPSGELEWKLFGDFQTEEAYIAFVDGLDAGDPEWIQLDDEVFYWIHSYDGEKFRDLAWDEDRIADFVIEMNEAY